MATKVRRKTDVKKTSRFKRKRRIAPNVKGTADRPRLAVFRSNKYISAQIIDDTVGKTLVAASSSEKELGKKTGIDGAKSVGALIAKRAMAKNMSAIVFDRSGYIYHGQIKALADSAREVGLKF